MLKISRYYYSIFQKIIEKSNLIISENNDQKILMFHEICDENIIYKDRNIAITLESFNKLLNIYINKGYKFYSLNDINSSYEKKTIYLTFDDVYLNVYKYVFPILKKNNLPFAIFVSVNFLDNEKYISKEMLIEMSKYQLCTVGSHSLTHPMLRWISEKEAEKEIFKSKIMLEEIINKKVNYFAYPYGSIFTCSKKNIEIVKRSGYFAAFSTIDSNINKYNKKYNWFLPRINVNEDNYMSIIRRSF